MISYWIRVAPKPMTGVLIRENRATGTHTEGRLLFEDRGRGWNDAAASQETPGIISNTGN